MKGIFTGLIMAAACCFLLNGCAAVTIWDSIKDRYEPYATVGQDGDKVMVKFTFDSAASSEVWLSGQFNGWAASRSLPKYPEAQLASGVLIPMKLDEKTKYWVVTIPLSPGRYTYKYVLDAGRVWSEDPNTDTVDDGFGGRNSVIIVIAK